MQKMHSYVVSAVAFVLATSLASCAPVGAQTGDGGPPAPPPAANGRDGDDNGDGPPPGQDQRPGEDRPEQGRPGRPPRQRPPRIDGPSVEDLTRVLGLTDEQQQTIKAIIDSAQEKIDAALSETQRATLKKLRAQHGPPPRRDAPPPEGAPPNAPDDRNTDTRANRQDMANQGGAQDEDHGRPVALVARDLGVTPEQFRAAFRKVHPAGAGQEPTEEQRRANRKVLSETLGVSPEKLDEVMDRYRPGGRGTNGLYRDMAPPLPPNEGE